VKSPFEGEGAFPKIQTSGQGQNWLPKSVRRLEKSRTAPLPAKPIVMGVLIPIPERSFGPMLATANLSQT
jgi:hypothetical protein